MQLNHVDTSTRILKWTDHPSHPKHQPCKRQTNLKANKKASILVTVTAVHVIQEAETELHVVLLIQRTLKSINISSTMRNLLREKLLLPLNNQLNSLL